MKEPIWVKCTADELWRYVAWHLEDAGIHSVLVGGAVVSIYTEGLYVSGDLDIVTDGTARSKLEVVLKGIGFEPSRSRYYKHPECEHLFLKVGITQIKEVLEKIGIEAKWTMKAEALEFRESKALEEKQGEKVVRDPDETVAQLLAASASERPETLLEDDEGEDPEYSAEVVPCPFCQAGIPMSSLSEGMNHCPGCGGEIEVAIAQ